jgi:hypothetical protein
MTAFVVGPYRDRVEILSDGAEYTPDGIVLGTAYKVHPSEALPLAVVGSGAVAEIKLMADMILAAADATGSVDAALKLLAGALSEIGESPNLDTGLRIAIGAISESDGPVCYVFSTFDDPGSSVGAFELCRMPRVFAQGAAPTGADFAAYGALSIEHGLEKDAVFMMDAMRRQKMVNPAASHREPIHSVGGHIDLTVISAKGITSACLHTWPDVIGQPITP